MKTVQGICSQCKTGKDSLILDRRSLECPHLYLCDGKKCTKFVKIDATCEDKLLKKLSEN